MSQHLVFANSIPLVLKFFDQNIEAYIGSKNNIALLDFLSCVIGEQPELTAETLGVGGHLGLQLEVHGELCQPVEGS
jgi:hypothetical protein